MNVNREYFDTLVIVCCHAIWLGGPMNGKDESEWLIEPFQSGETPTFIDHVRAGIQALSDNSKAMLVFSGGATKRSSTKLTEAEGYHRLALANDLFGFDSLDSQCSSSSIKNRIFQESFATDSYQNVLFSLIQFPLLVQRYLKDSTVTLNHSKEVERSAVGDHPFPKFPSRMIIISHEFKRSRFLDLHLPAIKWNGKTEYIGINPPFDPMKIAEIEEGDRKRGYGVWKDDLYGNGDVLVQKRMSRGYSEEDFKHDVLEQFPKSLEETLAKFLDWKGKTKADLYSGRLPWERDV